jgi:hypothetical protein
LATSIRRLRLRALVVVIWLVVGILVLSNYTWSHYEGPPPFSRCGHTQLGRDLLISLANESREEIGIGSSESQPDPVRPQASPLPCEEGS